jgi:hypothetical protein
VADLFYPTDSIKKFNTYAHAVMDKYSGLITYNVRFAVEENDVMIAAEGWMLIL